MEEGPIKKSQSFTKIIANQIDLLKRNSLKTPRSSLGESQSSYPYFRFVIACALIAICYYLITIPGQNSQRVDTFASLLRARLGHSPQFYIPESALDSLNIGSTNKRKIWKKAKGLEDISKKFDNDLGDIRKYGGNFGHSDSGLIRTVPYRTNYLKFGAPIRNVSAIKNFKKKFYHPWKEDPECKNFSYGFAKPHTFEPRALVSIPGSGVSWIRYLIESASGFITGSVHNEPRIYVMGFYGELYSPVEGSTILQRYSEGTLYNTTEHDDRYYLGQSRDLFDHRGILLLRNPFKSIIIYWLQLELEHTAFPAFVQVLGRKWRNLVISWIGQSLSDDALDPEKLLILQYEEVKLHPEREIKKILDYLGISPEPDRMACLMKHLENESLMEEVPTSAVRRIYTKVPILTSVIQDEVDSVNRFLEGRGLNLFLNYTLDTLAD